MYSYVNHAVFSPSHFLGGHYLFSFCFLFLLSYLVVPFPCSVFYQVQSLLGHLMDSKLQFYAPEHFWKCFKLWGQPVNVREQQVSRECAVMLILLEYTKPVNIHVRDILHYALQNKMDALSSRVLTYKITSFFLSLAIHWFGIY